MLRWFFQANAQLPVITGLRHALMLERLFEPFLVLDWRGREERVLRDQWKRLKALYSVLQSFTLLEALRRTE